MPERRPYHLRYRRMHPRTLDATDRLFRSAPWRGNQQRKFERWLERVSSVYRVPCPALTIVPPEECFGGGAYVDWGGGIIMMPHYSVVTLFHEFRHHLQEKGEVGPIRGIEDDARAWSLSLYHKVRPELFAHAVAEGRILHVE